MTTKVKVFWESHTVRCDFCQHACLAMCPRCPICFEYVQTPGSSGQNDLQRVFHPETPLAAGTRLAVFGLFQGGWLAGYGAYRPGSLYHAASWSWMYGILAKASSDGGSIRLDFQTNHKDQWQEMSLNHCIFRVDSSMYLNVGPETPAFALKLLEQYFDKCDIARHLWRSRYRTEFLKPDPLFHLSHHLWGIILDYLISAIGAFRFLDAGWSKLPVGGNAKT